MSYKYKIEIFYRKFYDNDDIKSAIDLLFKLIAWDPSDRISAEDAIKHEFFNN